MRRFIQNIGAALFGTVVTVGLFKTAEWVMKP